MADPFRPARNPQPGQKRGLLRVATELQREGRVDRSGLAPGLSAIASSFSQAGSQIGAIADHAAAKEGAEAGRQAGLDPEFRPTRSLTIRGEAYDKAGLEIYSARVKTSFAEELTTAFDAHQSDPQALGAALDAKAQSFIAESLPEVQPELQLMFEKSRFSFMRQAARAQAARIDAESKAALEADLTRGIKTVQQRGYWLGLDEKADEILASDISDVIQTMSRTGLDGKPLFSAAEIKKTARNLTAEVNDARLIGAYDRTSGLEGKAAFVEKFRQDYANSSGLARSYSFDDFQRILGKLESGLSREQTARKAQIRAAARDIQSVARRAEKGFPVPPDELAAIEAAVTSTADPETVATLSNAKSLLQLQETARSWPPARLNAVIASGREHMQKDGASDDQLARLALLEGLESEMRSQLKQDPNGWADRIGLVDVAPLDFSSAENAGATLKARIAQAEEIGAYYSQQPVYLRPDEKRQIATIAAQGGEQTLATASAIAEMAGGTAPSILSELFDDAPAVAMIGGLVAQTGQTRVARDAADGLALAKIDGFRSLAPSKTLAREAATDVLGDALATMPKSETAAMVLANAVYEIRARRQGLAEFDAELWQLGLREALGEQSVDGELYGGIAENDLSFWSSEPKIILPSFLSQDRWREAIDMLQAEDLEAAGLGKPIGGDGKPIPMERLKAATLIQSGNGRYALSLGDPSIPGEEGFIAVRNKRGIATFILDFNALEPILSRRRPDLFLGKAVPNSAQAGAP